MMVISNLVDDETGMSVVSKMKLYRAEIIVNRISYQESSGYLETKNRVADGQLSVI